MMNERSVYADEFRLNIELYGDANHYGLLVISDSRNKCFNPAPLKSIPIETATAEAVGKAITEYIKEYCAEK